MSLPAPLLDKRSADDIRQRLEELLNIYLKNAGAPLRTAPGNGVASALAGIFARYAELIIERLNQVPDKNRLAFFDLIGISPAPPQAARVPLTFMLAPGASGATVPARTPVAAAAGSGREQPVLFETERELSVTTARLTRLMSWDAPADRWSDLGAALAPGNAGSQVLFRGLNAVEHRLYVAQDLLLQYPDLNFNLSFGLQLAPADALDPRAISWELVLADGFEAIYPRLPADGVDPLSGYNSTDQTQQLTVSGDVIFNDPASSARGVPVPRTTVGGVSSRWLRLGLTPRINCGADFIEGSVRSAQLPIVSSLSFQGYGRSGSRNLEASFANAQPVDTNSDFYVFGPEARLGSAWYLGSREVLSQQNQRIRVKYELSDPNTMPYPDSSQKPTVSWEFWTGHDWRELGRSIRDINYGQSNVGPAKFSDNSNAFFSGAGEVSFVYPEAPQPTVVRGVESYWIRARLTAGNYNQSYGDPKLLKPPSLAFAKLSYDNGDTAAQMLAADALLRFDGLRYEQLAQGPFEPFKLADDNQRSLYLGFELPGTQTVFPQRAVSLYLDFDQPGYGEHADDASASIPPVLAWSYWSAKGWQRLLVRDETESLSASGMLEFLPPADFRPTVLFDSQPRWWLRLSWIGGDYRYLPRLRRVLQNAVMGKQTSTVSNEILGSSNGAAGQVFSAARKPVLSGPRLEVREPSLPSAAERAAAISEEGADAITALADGSGAWVRWHEVGDFHASGPRDRHYVLDHLSGEVSFGDGSSGLIPPRGAGNIRFASYDSGGGDAGNVEADAITQLKTTVPFVAGVSNPLAAGGGVGAETITALLDRAPRGIRHRERAVTYEDFEDLARLASTEVARSRCVPLLDLRDTNPLPRAGQLSLIIVPVSQALQPTPSVELIERVRQFIDARRLPGIDLQVLGAEYVSVDVSTQIGLKDLSAARDVELAVRDALESFLHPLSGGLDGRGWDFGRQPHRSDLYALLEAIDGIDYVRTLDVIANGPNQTDRFLVCSGNHRIDLYYGA
jgi:hypothetical protein